MANLWRGNSLTHDQAPNKRPTRLEEPLPWKAAGESPYYPDETSSAIEFVQAVESGHVYVYLWAADDGVAGGVIYVKSRGHMAGNAGVKWNQKMRAAKDRGISPVKAIEEFLAAAESIPHMGRVDVEAGMRHLGSLEALKELANGRQEDAESGRPVRADARQERPVRGGNVLPPTYR